MGIKTKVSVGFLFIAAAAYLGGQELFSYFKPEEKKPTPLPAPAVTTKGEMPSQNVKPVAQATTKPAEKEVKAVAVPKDLKEWVGKSPYELGLADNKEFKQKLGDILPYELVQRVVHGWKTDRCPSITRVGEGISFGSLYDYRDTAEAPRQSFMATTWMNNGAGGAYIQRTINGRHSIMVYSTKRPPSVFYSGPVEGFDPQGIAHVDVIKAHIKGNYLSYDQFRAKQAAVAQQKKQMQDALRKTAPSP